MGDVARECIGGVARESEGKGEWRGFSLGEGVWHGDGEELNDDVGVGLVLALTQAVKVWSWPVVRRTVPRAGDGAGEGEARSWAWETRKVLWGLTFEDDGV